MDVIFEKSMGKQLAMPASGSRLKGWGGFRVGDCLGNEARVGLRREALL